MARLLALVFLVLGCGSQAPLTEEMRYVAGEGYEVDAENCVIPVSPAPGLEAIVATAIEDWARYVDCELVISGGGIPFLFGEPREGYAADTTYLEDPVDDRYWKVGSVVFREHHDGRTYHTDVTHELFHVLGGFEHTEKGVAASPGVGRWVDRFAIDKVCERLNCLDQDQ